eukprot:TRINITY_DN48992_c0_g1_i1.p1 TRINITY_DN48992_c0_g1~~TRINITY_DN48992_c0_g1_i1.p1  ORF type:complete len:123 (+),score=19.59 TRINITY_DN48992_c0_g1_i1:32-370(+)
MEVRVVIYDGYREGGPNKHDRIGSVTLGMKTLINQAHQTPTCHFAFPLQLSRRMSISGGGGEEENSHWQSVSWRSSTVPPVPSHQTDVTKQPEIGRAVQQECRDRSRMPSSA